MRHSLSWIAVAGVVLAVAASLAGTPAASAADRTFTLYGDQNQGWRLPGGSFGNPGPALVVDAGDNVTLVLNATDGVNHNWFVDYNNDTGDDGAEPNSPVFRDAQISWNFTANRNGTFAYRDKFHPDAMMGWITVRQATSPPATPGGNPGNPFLAVAGIVVAFLAILLALYFLTRRKPAPDSERVQPDPESGRVDRP